MHGVTRVASGAALCCAAALWLLASAPAAQADSFAARIAALSEPAGYFDTDNLISNERSYLHVAGALEAAAVPGGAYVGVGPDQNFSYIAIARPSLAVIIDVRRDNLLLHLLFKALFEIAGTRVEYLTLLSGRAPPGTLEGWRARPIDALVGYVDAAPRLGPAARAALDARIIAAVRGFGVPLSDADYGTIRRFHRRFIDDGLSLRFNSTGRPPQRDYPSYRDLLVERDRAGVPRSFLASEAAFQFVKSLQARHLVIPVVGDLSGPTALRAVGDFLRARRAPLVALYASNVEFYLFGDGRFDRFVDNLGRLPRADSAVIVRSAFRGGVRIEPGYNSASLAQPMAALLDGYAQGRFRRYTELLAASK
jgi:hypothetical protein